MNTVKCYVTKRSNGLYLVTAFKPVICHVRGTNRLDAYIKYGDPIGYNNIRPKYIESVFRGLIEDQLNVTKSIMSGFVTLDIEKMTHLISVNEENLFRIHSLCDTNEYIDHVCYWFINNLFNVKELRFDEKVPVYFQGEYNV
jgi:hypothetical protein